MAIHTQNGFSAKMITSGIVSALGMVKKDTAQGYYKAFQNLAKDSLVAQLEAVGAVDRTLTEKYTMHFSNNKQRNLFRVKSDVEVTDSGQVTVEIDLYTDDAKQLSAPAEGLFFRENSTGIEFQVHSVDKTTAGAHTATISPTVKGVTETILASDAEFISVGRPTVQEASFQQDGEYKGWAERDNYTRIIRTNKSYTDLATMLGVEQSPSGETYYDLDKSDMPQQHIDAKEFEIVMGIKRDNVTSTGNRNTLGQGFLPLIQEYGTTLGGSAGAVLDRDMFRTISRIIDGNGLTDSYNGLADTEAMIQLQDFLETANVTVQNASATGSELKAIFDYNTNFVIDGIEYGFKKYNYFNANRLAGADNSKSFLSNRIVLMPNGGFTNSEGISKPYLGLKVLDNPSVPTDEGYFNHLDNGGALFGQGTTRIGEVSITSYMGGEINGVEGFIDINLKR